MAGLAPPLWLLLATIPSRRPFCGRLLADVLRQTRKPDRLLLYCDGYRIMSPPASCLPTSAMVNPTNQGAGHRWTYAEEMWRIGLTDSPPIIVNLDDDAYIAKAPRLLETLHSTVMQTGAAASVGVTIAGRRAAPGTHSQGALIYGAGSGFAVRADLLLGFSDFACEMQRVTGQDFLAPCGDDDACLSAFLWTRGVTIQHAPGGVFHSAPGSQTTSQTKERLALGKPLDTQKKLLAAATGWPYSR